MFSSDRDMSNAMKLLLKAQSFENRGLFWEASRKYQEALLLFNKSKGHEGEKALCKKKIREMNMQKAKNFNSADSHIFLSEQEKNTIEQFQSFIQNKTLHESLDIIGDQWKFFCPSFDSVKSSVVSNSPLFGELCNFDTQNSQGDYIKDGNDAKTSWFFTLYRLEQIKRTHLFLVPTFNESFKKKEADSENFLDYFQSKELFSKDFLCIIDVALSRLLAFDYISALSIFVPQFEKVFCDITLKINPNIDCVKALPQKGDGSKIWTQDKIFSEEFVKDSQVKAIWGEDFCEQIAFVFLSQLGYSLRHKVAHGKLPLADFSRENTLLVLYFFIVISARVQNNNR
jgi:hypothetical protein